MPCVIIISNGSAAGLNIASELSLAPCMALFLATKHSLQLRKGAEGLGCPPCHSRLLPGSACCGCAGPPISWREVFRAEMLFASDTPTHTKKNGALRVLVPFKRANISAFCLYDRAAGLGLGDIKTRHIPDTDIRGQQGRQRQRGSREHTCRHAHHTAPMPHST